MRNVQEPYKCTAFVKNTHRVKLISTNIYEEFFVLNNYIQYLGLKLKKFLAQEVAGSHSDILKIKHMHTPGPSKNHLHCFVKP